jgi:aspartyl protease family protein
MRRSASRRRSPRLLTVLFFGLVGVLLFLMLAQNSGSGFGMKSEDFGQLAVLVVILIFVGIGLFARPMRPGEAFRSITFWFMAIVILVALHAYRAELAVVGGRVLGALVPGVPITGQLAGESDPDTVVVVRSRDRHFNLRADINEISIPLLLDTGASFVMLTQDDALAVGVDLASLAFIVPIRTANGTIRAAATTLDRISIGPIDRRNIPALIAPDTALDQSLLGLSFLDTLRGYAVSGDRLVLSP